MTEQHECEWVVIADNGEDPIGMCMRCPERLSDTEIDRRLNEYETLKKATEALSVELALTALHYIETGGGKMGEALRNYANILESK